jgi:hypothetical protein
MERQQSLDTTPEQLRAWKDTTSENRIAARKVAAKFDKMIEILYVLVLPALLSIALTPMAVTMLMRHRELSQYSQTTCLKSYQMTTAWCGAGHPPCGEAYSLSITGQKIRLTFPSYSKILEWHNKKDLNEWRKTVQLPTFTCYVRNSENSSEGVTYIELRGLDGWYFMSGLSALFLVLVFILFVYWGFYYYKYIVGMRKLPLPVKNFLEEIIKMNYIGKTACLGHFDRVVKGLQRRQRMVNGYELPDLHCHIFSGNLAFQGTRFVFIDIDNSSFRGIRFTTNHPDPPPDYALIDIV